jgi:hypothetical protein
MWKKYYDNTTKTLILPSNYIYYEELKIIPKETEIIVFNEDINIFSVSEFNEPVDDLPENLLEITFGYRFNQSVDNLPNKLIKLTLGTYFDKPINYLPASLKYLALGRQTPVRLAHPKIFIIFEMT